jgi:Cytochrome c551/c552
VGKVDAVAMLALAKSSGCLACHALQQKKIGPAYAAIAARYANKPGALVTLQRAILQGESGTWGVIPMPAYGGSQNVLTPAQAHDLAQWILGLAPGA